MPRAFLLLALLIVGCSPRLAPPYRDYEVRVESTDDLGAQLRAAVEGSGWEILPSSDPSIVSTAEREVAEGFFSNTVAALNLVPLDGGFVRIYIRAEKRNVFGGRSKVYALDGNLRAAILGDLSDSLRERGLVPLGTPRDRDEDVTE